MVWWVKPIVVNILEWVFAGIATVFFLLRFYIRYYGVRGQPPHFSFKLSDWVLTITLICFYAANISDTVTVVLIDGVDRMNLSPNRSDPLSAYALLEPNRLRTLLKVLYSSLYPYYSSWWGVKFYILILYYKIVEPMTLPYHRLALHALTLLVFLTYFSWVSLYIFWCLPVSDNWNVYATPENYCVAYFSRKPFVITIGMHAGTEILIFAFPFSFLYLIRRISKQKFYAVTMMFGVGFLGVIISLSRVAYIVTSNHAPVIGIINAWGALEQCVGIIVCCLPAFKSLLKRRRSNNSGWDSSELVERTFNSDGAPESRGRSAESGDTLGCNSGSWNRSLPSDRQSVILRVDSFERISRMESVREVMEAETASREMVQDIKNTAPTENHNIRWSN
ncbi:hypothetical protein TWF225_009556 [Orbilia oligospora]|uniref:Rhodopsin domain-containing protein n=1 Tax=Orbilia oligospora TaxID=2813651 RepID=A0A7C8KAU0_ORBOL|nr:hypothetical protein TWF751_010834 [Orbilia oligospora]KAF3174130.1 hypothetical protein TWF225_009556 [Orbilia oligospora]KAF3241689.1 hypothetical protein TWF128_010696 [Orbilia oligospora]KAF3241690.1 hypothetical protein TWF128_010696 [Orbilia oligospora]KAF3249802.1 hypothetical protein TWF217_008712 [Orbilia oligospora]